MLEFLLSHQSNIAYLRSPPLHIPFILAYSILLMLSQEVVLHLSLLVPVVLTCLLPHPGHILLKLLSVIFKMVVDFSPVSFSVGSYLLTDQSLLPLEKRFRKHIFIKEKDYNNL